MTDRKQLVSSPFQMYYCNPRPFLLPEMEEMVGENDRREISAQMGAEKGGCPPNGSYFIIGLQREKAIQMIDFFPFLQKFVCFCY